MPDTDAMLAGVIRNLPERTGRSLEEWTALLEREVPGAPFGERQAYLVREHGLAAGDARTIIHVSDYMHRPSDDSLVDAQYTGAKAALRPIYDAVVAAVRALGDDATVDPRKTYVSFSRARQFALVQASTRTRVDLGLRLVDPPASERLVPAGSFGSGNISHRVSLTTTADVDGELRGWLQAAYAEGG
jgi:predicted transport protein